MSKIPKEITKAIKALRTDKHRKFVATYIKQIAAGKTNSAEAYRAAGYNPKSPQAAAAGAGELLGRPDIKAIVEMARAHASAASIAEVEAAIGSLEWKRQQLIGIAGQGRSLKVDAQGNQVPVDLGAARASVMDLAKIDGDVTTKMEITGHESLLEMLQ